MCVSPTVSTQAYLPASLSSVHSRCSVHNACCIRESRIATRQYRTPFVASAVCRRAIPRRRKSAPLQIKERKRASYGLRATVGQSAVSSSARFVNAHQISGSMQAQKHPDEKSLWPKNDDGELAGFNSRCVRANQYLDLSGSRTVCLRLFYFQCRSSRSLLCVQGIERSNSHIFSTLERGGGAASTTTTLV